MIIVGGGFSWCTFEWKSGEKIFEGLNLAASAINYPEKRKGIRREYIKRHCHLSSKDLLPPSCTLCSAWLLDASLCLGVEQGAASQWLRKHRARCAAWLFVTGGGCAQVDAVMHGYLRYGCTPQPPSCTRCVDFQHFIFSLLLSFTRYLFDPLFLFY